MFDEYVYDIYVKTWVKYIPEREYIYMKVYCQIQIRMNQREYDLIPLPVRNYDASEADFFKKIQDKIVYS